MATITRRMPLIIGVSQAVRRSSDVARETPFIPLLILTMLPFLAISAPVLAPHSALDPVTPTREQCLARDGIAACPYLVNAPPSCARERTVHPPLGLHSLGRAV